jgi:hypothetical protein
MVASFAKRGEGEFGTSLLEKDEENERGKKETRGARKRREEAKRRERGKKKRS